MAPNVPRKLLLQDRLVQDPVTALQEILDHFQAGVHTIRSLFFGTGQSWTWAFGLIWRSCSFWLSCGLSSIWLSLVNIGASTSTASHRFPIWWPFWGRGHSSSFFSIGKAVQCWWLMAVFFNLIGIFLAPIFGQTYRNCSSDWLWFASVVVTPPRSIRIADSAHLLGISVDICPQKNISRTSLAAAWP